MKLIVFGLDGVLLDIDSKTSTFDILLEKLGKGEEAKKLQEKYLEDKSKGPSLLKEKTALFKDMKEEDLVKISKDYVKESLMKGFKETLKELKEKEFSIAIFSSNPQIVLEVIKEEFNEIDFICGSELENKDGLLTGHSLHLSFKEETKEEVLKKFPDIEFTKEPNRYGLFIKLFELVKEKEVDVEKSFIVGNKLTKNIMLKLIKRGICFNPIDVEMEEKSEFTMREKDLKKIMGFID